MTPALGTVDSQDVQFSIKVEATGLKAYTKYHYRFESCEGADLGVSRVGSFKTLPAEDQLLPQVRLATVRSDTVSLHLEFPSI